MKFLPVALPIVSTTERISAFTKLIVMVSCAEAIRKPLVAKIPIIAAVVNVEETLCTSARSGGAGVRMVLFCDVFGKEDFTSDLGFYWERVLQARYHCPLYDMRIAATWQRVFVRFLAAQPNETCHRVTLACGRPRANAPHEILMARRLAINKKGRRCRLPFFTAMSATNCLDVPSGRAHPARHSPQRCRSDHW